MMIRFKLPEGYVIPEADEAHLRQILNLPIKDDSDPPPLPDQIRVVYYMMKRCLDILGINFTEWQLATTVCLAMLSEDSAVNPISLIPSVSEQPTFREVVLDGLVITGGLVAVLWHDEWVPGYFFGFQKDQVIVQMAGSERYFDMADVRQAEELEFPNVKENINDPD